MKVLLGMSGGLDSTYAAHLLAEQGYDVEGAVLVMHGFTDTDSAKRSAAENGIKLHILDGRAKFAESVERPFADEYMRGRTPNPCVFCNPAVKFRLLRDYTDAHGFDYIATGHYAGVAETGGRYAIKRGAFAKKDQSYALWGLTQDELSGLILPLADLDKGELRGDAERLGFSSASSPESQEICFIPDHDYAGWLERERGYTPVPGDFIDKSGKKLGEHRGVAFYTVGQRKGLGGEFGRPMYVAAIDYAANTVTLAEAGGEFGSHMRVTGLNFQSLMPEAASGELRLTVRIRYAAQPVPCAVTFDGDTADIAFDSPARAVTPGQSAVFYDGDIIAFGGFIR